MVRLKFLTSLLFCTVKANDRKSEADRQIGWRLKLSVCNDRCVQVEAKKLKRALTHPWCFSLQTQKLQKVASFWLSVTVLVIICRCIFYPLKTFCFAKCYSFNRWKNVLYNRRFYWNVFFLSFTLESSSGTFSCIAYVQ